jgi:hypothetical protein
MYKQQTKSMGGGGGSLKNGLGLEDWCLSIFIWSPHYRFSTYLPFQLKTFYYKNKQLEFVWVQCDRHCLWNWHIYLFGENYRFWGGGGSLKNGLGLEDWCLSWGLCQSVEWSISTVKV